MKKISFVSIFAISLVVMVGLGGYFALAKDDGTFELVDISGNRSYLENFPITGFAGDGSCGFTYIIDENGAEAKYDVLSGGERESLFLAEFDGVTGTEKYDYYPYYKNESVQGDRGYMDIIPTSEDMVEVRKGWVPTADLIGEEDAKNLEYMNMNVANDEYIQTVIVSKGEVCMTVYSRKDIGGNVTLSTGMYLDEDRYTVEQRNIAGDMWSGQTFGDYYNGQTIVAEDGIFAMMETGDNMVGNNTLYFIADDDFLPYMHQENTIKGAEFESKRGKATAIVSFPLEEVKPLQLFGLGKDKLGVSVKKDSGFYLQMYDRAGKLLDELFLGSNNPKEVRDLNFTYTETATGEVVLQFNSGVLVEQNENTQVWEQDRQQLILVIGDKLETLELCDWMDDDSLCLEMAMHHDNLLCLYTMESPEEPLQNFYPNYVPTIAIWDMDTKELLYKGEIATDFNEDFDRLFAYYNAGRNQNLKQSLEQIGTYQYIENYNYRYFGECLPEGGKQVNIWS